MLAIGWAGVGDLLWGKSSVAPLKTERMVFCFSIYAPEDGQRMLHVNIHPSVSHNGFSNERDTDLLSGGWGYGDMACSHSTVLIPTDTGKHVEAWQKATWCKTSFL